MFQNEFKVSPTYYKFRGTCLSIDTYLLTNVLMTCIVLYYNVLINNYASCLITGKYLTRCGGFRHFLAVSKHQTLLLWMLMIMTRRNKIIKYYA